MTEVVESQPTEVLPVPSAETPKESQPAESAPASQETKPPEKPADPPSKPSQARYDRKIDKLHRKAAEAAAKAEFLERQLSDPNFLEQRLGQFKPKTHQPGSPRMEDFQDIESYAAARESFAREQAIRDYHQQQIASQSKAQQEAVLSSWEAKTSKAETKFEDFDEVVGDLKPITPWALAIMQSENGDEVAYYLGKHIKEAQKIAQMDPVSQIREIGRLEAKLLAEPPKQKAASNAPAPINPISGTGAPESGLREGMTYEQFVKIRNKQKGRT